MELSMNICNDHAINDVTLFMDDAGWEELRANFEARRMYLPKREDLKVKFKALEDRKFA